MTISKLSLKYCFAHFWNRSVCVKSNPLALGVSIWMLDLLGLIESVLAKHFSNSVTHKNMNYLPGHYVSLVIEICMVLSLT